MIGFQRRASFRNGLMAALAGVAIAGPAAAGAIMTAEPAAAVSAVAPSAIWSADAARQLIAVIEDAKTEGLRPTDYGLAGLRAGLDAGPGPALDAAAGLSAMMLARDFAFGRVGDRAAFDWHMEASPYDASQLADRLRVAIATGKVDTFLKGLLPADARYVALRGALAAAETIADRDRIRANMERWRWMPRDLGGDYLYVNVPSYQLKVVSGGAAISTYTVVVGAKDTPTPLMVSPSSSLVVNPWWNVPVSIVRKSNLRPGRGGYVFKANNDGSYAVRQPPGPRNALGRIKFNLVNDQAIYLHDTPAKAGFERDQRALSHGCIRIKDIDQLAAELMGDGGDVAKLDAALADSTTQTLRLPRTWKVYLVYFTADVGEDGAVVSLDDPYGRDAPLLARLDGRPMQIASR